MIGSAAAAGARGSLASQTTPSKRISLATRSGCRRAYRTATGGRAVLTEPGVGARAGEGEGPESLFVKLLAGRLGTELHPTLAPELGGPHGNERAADERKVDGAR